MPLTSDAARGERAPSPATPPRDTRPDLPYELPYGLRVVPVPALTPPEREAMRALLAEYYDGVSAEQFAADLDEKRWVLLGTEPDGAVWCFSTLMTLQATVDGEPLLAFYSGDTVVRRECWGRESAALVGLVLRHMLAVAAGCPDRRPYWFMISSTYKSYRLLSQLFREYGPAPGRPLSAPARRVVAELSRLKGFTSYDPERSVVRFPNPTLFRDETAPSPSPGPAPNRDPAATFFAASNPGARDGDRLAALAELRPENLTPVGRRLVENRLDPRLRGDDDQQRRHPRAGGGIPAEAGIQRIQPPDSHGHRSSVRGT